MFASRDALIRTSSEQERRGADWSYKNIKFDLRI